MCAHVCAIHYLPLWPVILGEDGIICVHRSICHQHNGLAALTTPPSLVELEIERGVVVEGLRQVNKNKISLHSKWKNNLSHRTTCIF